MLMEAAMGPFTKEEMARWNYSLTPEEEGQMMLDFVRGLSRERALALMVDAGIYNPDGTLTDFYRGVEEEG
jgi:hypothetical protein